jgi:spore germination protein YaaH
MSPAVRRVVVALGLSASAVFIAFPTSAAAGACGAAQPTGLVFHRQAGKHVGVLNWKSAKKSRSARYRVYRNGVVVGQTLGRAMRVRVKPGDRYLFEVTVVSSAGKATTCTASLARQLRYYAPFPPRHLAVKRVTRTAATLVWSAARRGDGRLAGYRVFRNGVAYRQVKRRRLRIGLGPGVSKFTVAAADTRGQLSRLSRTVQVRSGHHPPKTPRYLRIAGVSDTQVALAWSAASASKKSRSASASKVVGYRIYRYDTVVRQVSGLGGTVTNLAPATGYRFAVAAVDSLGYQSAPTAPISVTTALPTPTTGRIHAFLLATTDESFRDLQRHYTQIGTVYPTYYDCYGPAGAIRGIEDPLVTHWAQLRRILVMPRFDCQRPDTIHQILTNSASRASTIAGLMNLVRTYGYDGLNLDFEAGYATDRDAFTSFSAALAQQLHAIGKRLTAEVSAKWTNTLTGRSGFYDYAALGAVVDTVFVMNWGWHWTTSGPGSPDEINNVVKVADYTASMPNKSRFVLGVPLYVQDWPNGGGSSSPSTPIEYGDLLGIIAKYGGTPVLDTATDTWHYNYTDAIGYHDVWYPDATTVATRVRVAKARGLGIGFWRLGTEDQRIWNDPLLAPGSSWP